MSKIISFSKEKQKEGINKIVDLMAITIGPRGRNVSLTNGDTVNDGRRIAEDISLKDFTENKGADKVRKLVRKISSDVGGGRTATAILYKTLINTGMDLLNRGFNFNLLKKGMLLAVKDIHAEIDKMSQSSKGKLKQIATISTESEELGQVIADTMEKIGKDGIATVEQSNTFGITTEIAEGLKFDKGFVSPYMITNERQEAEYKDISVLITDKKISFFKDMQPIFDSLIKKSKKDLFIIAEDFEGEALNISIIAKIKGQFNTLAIKTPGLGDNKKFCIEDLCALTGAELWTEFSTEPKLGKAKKITSTKDTTVILGGEVKTWIKILETRKDLTDNVWEKDQFTERIAKLKNGIAVIKVGASSEDEVKYLKLKIEDGVNETKRAMEEGIVMGGNVSFIHATKNLNPGLNSEEEMKGYEIVLKAVEAPLRQIVENGADKPDVVIEILNNNESLTLGYNSLETQMTDDMYADGIIDATKVVKTVLQYAVNEAILFLSIGGDISEEIIEK